MSRIVTADATKVLDLGGSDGVDHAARVRVLTSGHED
jgi:hypothetical protein